MVSRLTWLNYFNEASEWEDFEMEDFGALLDIAVVAEVIELVLAGGYSSRFYGLS